MYYFTGIQHTKTGDIAIPTLTYASEDAAKDKWHKERSYAYDSTDFSGLTTIIYDNAGNIILKDNWVREVEPEQPEEQPEEG